MTVQGGVRGARLPWRALLGVAVPALVAALASASCETQPPYADCELDSEVTKKGVCSGAGSVGTGTTSCVVTKHPHCPAGVCASHFGSKAFCTTPCTVDGDCTGDAFCWTFADSERYCVPKDRAK